MLGHLKINEIMNGHNKILSMYAKLTVKYLMYTLYTLLIVTQSFKY